MRMIIRLLSGLGFVALTFALAVTTAMAQYPIDGSGVTVGIGTPDPGECFTASVPGLTPGASVTFVFADASGSTTTVLAVADASGVASAELCVPVDAATGEGNITVSDETQVLGEVIVSVGAQDSGGDLAITGRTIGSTVGIGVLAIVVGGVLVALSRRRERIIS